MRELEESDLDGKTIKKATKVSINNIKLEFDDGTSISIWTEPLLFLTHGRIYGFVIDNDPSSNEESPSEEVIEKITEDESSIA